MKRFWWKVLFYIVAVPLSWIPLDLSVRIYHKVRNKAWPLESPLTVFHRDQAAHIMAKHGYFLRQEDSRVYAHNFSGREFVLAEHENLAKMWELAYEKAKSYK